MPLQSYKGYEKKRMEKNALYTYAVRLPRGLMTPLFVRTTLRVKWLSLLMNCSFSILLILIHNGVNQEETNWNSLVQLTSERSNRLLRPLQPWRALNEILWWCMPAKSRPPISVHGVLTIDGWDQKQKEFRNLYQTQTIGDISWMSLGRNRQAGHWATLDDYLPRKWLKDLHDEHSGSVINDGDTIKSFCSKYNVDEKHVIIYINHLKVIDIRKDIWTREAEERKRQEAERTYKDFKWDGSHIESGKIEKVKVKELEFYLNEHGLTLLVGSFTK